MNERQATLQTADQLMQTSIWRSSSFVLTIRLALQRRISIGRDHCPEAIREYISRVSKDA
jgi:hypothetical protein